MASERSPERWERLKVEALDTEALIPPEDKDPLDTVLRRTDALLQYFRRRGEVPEKSLSEFDRQLVALATKAAAAPTPDARKEIFFEACKLRRDVAMVNPLLNFDQIVALLEKPGGGRIIEQARACWGGHSTGGGPIVISNFKTVPKVERPLDTVPVTSGQWKDKVLNGLFSGLELSFDGKQLLFAATTDTPVWRIFRYDIASKRLEQLTDGPEDDFDPCLLPSGRIAFTSTRRGGIGRCLLPPKALTYTLHSMERDGSDVITLSYHETNEWQPSVTHNGMLVYTRWDYLDRRWAAAHHMWLCFPDGRDPRNYHGNYSLPRSAFMEGIQPSEYGKHHPSFPQGRLLRPDAEVAFRAITGSPKYTATAVGHHQGFSGSLVMIDPRIPDDGKTSQLKRITPEHSFPETERTHSRAYGTAWPLNEDFYLCNYNTGLYLLDRFGNQVVIYDPGDQRFRVRAPFPLQPRKTPPVIPVKTWQGKRAGLPDHKRATLKVMNCYIGDMPLPEGTQVKWMRIIQVIPQMLTRINGHTIRYISFADESIGRIPLGVVPVEEDGSIYCEVPVGKALYFQLLNEEGMAVQSMRSITYAHAGEQVSCMGCHEDKWKAPPSMKVPTAFKRAPSKIVPEVDSGIFPYNFYKLVKQPVFDKKCLPCHNKMRAKHPKAPDMSYGSLAKNHLLFGLAGEPTMMRLGVGGSRTTPGHFGAHASGLVKLLKTDKHHEKLKLTKDEWRRITLWIDMNGNHLGWIGDDMKLIEAQRRGEDVWPPIDIDPKNPIGVENAFPAPSR